MALPLKPMAMFALVREFQSISAEQATVAVSGSGTGELAAVLRRELARGEGADPAAVVASWQGATALLRVQAGPLDAAGEEELRAANAAKVPIVAIIVEGGPEAAPGSTRSPRRSAGAWGRGRAVWPPACPYCGPASARRS
jgi:hypothetical protein